MSRIVKKEFKLILRLFYSVCTLTIFRLLFTICTATKQNNAMFYILVLLNIFTSIIMIFATKEIKNRKKTGYNLSILCCLLYIPTIIDIIVNHNYLYITEITLYIWTMTLLIKNKHEFKKNKHVKSF